MIPISLNHIHLQSAVYIVHTSGERGENCLCIQNIEGKVNAISKNDVDKRNFNKYKNFVSNRIRAAKSKFVNNKLAQAFTSAQVWNVYKVVKNIRRKRAEPICTLTNNNQEVKDKNQICDLLSNQFALPGDDNSAAIAELCQSTVLSEYATFLYPHDIVNSFKKLKPTNSNNHGIPFPFLANTIETLAIPHFLQ